MADSGVGWSVIQQIDVGAKRLRDDEALSSERRWRRSLKTQSFLASSIAGAEEYAMPLRILSVTLLCAVVFLAPPASLFAQDEGKKAFTVDDVILDSVKELGPPRKYPELVSWNPAITANDDEVQEHFANGIALVHAKWDFEAYRHFVEAVKKDPECLMAYWGMVLSLGGSNTETNNLRLAAINRMLDLVETGVGTLLEQGQAEALALRFSNQSKRSPEVFDAVASDFPNDLHLQLMAALVRQDGYDSVTGARLGQRRAVARIEELVKENPDNNLALSFWTTIQAEHPDATGTLRGEILPLARTQVERAPEVASQQELLAHFERRAGNLQLAKRGFEKAISLYRAYLKKDGVTYYDCPNLIRCQLNLASVLYALDDFNGAMAIADELLKLPIDKKRLYSPGATLVLWEGRTLKARLFLARGAQGDYTRGLAALPSDEEGKELRLETPAVLAWVAWSHALSGRIALEAREMQKAAQLLDTLAKSDEFLSDVQAVVTNGSSRQSWSRTRVAIKVQWMLNKAEYSEKSEEMPQASFYLSQATSEAEAPEKVHPALNFSCPLLEYADFSGREGKLVKAEELFQKALKRYPNNVLILNRYSDFLRKSDNFEKASAILKHIETVQEIPGE